MQPNRCSDGLYSWYSLSRPFSEQESMSAINFTGLKHKTPTGPGPTVGAASAGDHFVFVITKR